MTSSSTLWLIEPSSTELDTRTLFESWIDRIVAVAPRHARFANTLSLLEHIGSVKIARTQSGAGIDADVLQHLAEEARHAHILKRVVMRLAGTALPGYRDDELLAGSAARGYFARLDTIVRAFVREEVESAGRAAAAYNLVTWLIERRAMWLYPAYQRTLEAHRSRVSVRSLISDETRHLEEVVAAMQRSGLAESNRVEEIVRGEESLFARLASSMIDASAA